MYIFRQPSVLFVFYDYLLKAICSLFKGESTLTEALTATGKTYEEIAEIVAGQVWYHAVNPGP